MEIKKRERGERNGGKMKHGDVLLSYIDYLASLIKNTDETVVIQSDDRILEGFRYEKEVEQFLKTAEKQGMIAQMGLLQFRRVCRFVKEHEYLMKTLKITGKRAAEAV